MVVGTPKGVPIFMFYNNFVVIKHVKVRNWEGIKNHL